MKIFIASGNKHKINEIKAILTMLNLPVKYELLSIEGMQISEPDEPYSNFMENACYKAKYYAAFTKAPTLSEDSGLCIEALDSFPGVHTKNFVSECGDIENAYSKLEELLIGKSNRAAYFYCAAALYLPLQDRCLTAEGKFTGTISFPPRGDQGFAFDPVFIPDGYHQTMAELGEQLKHKIGHRGMAIRELFMQIPRHAEIFVNTFKQD